MLIANQRIKANELLSRKRHEKLRQEHIKFDIFFGTNL